MGRASFVGLFLRGVARQVTGAEAVMVGGASLAVTLKELEALPGPDSREVGVTLTVNIEMTHHATCLQDAGPASA